MMDLKINISLFIGGKKSKEWRDKKLKDEDKKNRKDVIAELNKPQLEVVYGKRYK